MKRFTTTQRRHLGADIEPLTMATGTPRLNDAAVTALAARIAERRPHRVELQGRPCNDPGIAVAFSDRLADNLAALGDCNFDER